jgi:hypothetical protein
MCIHGRSPTHPAWTAGKHWLPTGRSHAVVQFQRPDLLAVLLLTSFVSAAGALLVRTALHR